MYINFSLCVYCSKMDLSIDMILEDKILRSRLSAVNNEGTCYKMDLSLDMIRKKDSNYALIFYYGIM